MEDNSGKYNFGKMNSRNTIMNQHPHSLAKAGITWLTMILLSYAVYGQGVRGRIYTSEQEPLAFTTIYIQQQETGTTSNQEGFYEVKLPPGQYDLVFQYLGYETVVRSVTVADAFVKLDVTLNEQVVQLREVEVRAGKEDPAYTIIRKAIAKSKFHRLEVQHYTAQVYVKGAGRVKDVPFLLERRLEKEGIDSSTIFLSESVSEITFDQPNTVKERVLSIRSVGEGNNTSPTPFINGSFYNPTVAQAISPLSPRAFAYYKFRLEGSFRDRGYEVNKIRVIPRSRGDDVFNGYIYIIEDLWSIHSLKLFTYKQGFKIEASQIYSPIEETVWLPVTHRIEVTGKVFGFDLEYKYLATVSNYAIELNPALSQEIEVVDEKVDRELAEVLAKEERGAQDTITRPVDEQAFKQQQRYTRKQLKKALRNYEKELDRQEEAPEVVSDFNLNIDSLAYRKDSTYWAAVRPVPLNTRERQSYQKLDSMAVAEPEEEEENDNANKKRGSLGSVLLGTTLDLGKKSTFQYASPLGELQYNPVEGAAFNVPLTYRNELDSLYTLAVSAVPRYSFARNKLIGKGSVSLDYPAVSLIGRITLEGGRFVSQFNEQEPISPLLNSLIALWQKRNYVKLYEKDYGRLNLEQPLTPRLTINTTLEWAERRQLFNQTDYSLRRREQATFAPNAPLNEELTDTGFPTHQALWGEVTFGYEPWLKYYVRNGEKRRIDQSSPRFHLTYRKGLPRALASDINYDLLEVGVRHQLRVGARGRLDYNLYAGGFLNNQSLYFMDFRHFAGNRIVVQESDPVASFRLLDYYTYSTRERYAVAHVYYQFRKLLLTRIFEVRMLGLKENVLVNHLKTSTSPHYTEVGYSLDNIFRFFRVEAVASFQDGTYQDFGIRIGISTNVGNAIGL